MDAASLPIVKAHACPECGHPVVCGLANGASNCWCMELERVLPVGNDPNSLCYCEACLRAKIAAVAVYVANSLRELESDSRSESAT